MKGMVVYMHIWENEEFKISDLLINGCFIFRRNVVYVATVGNIAEEAIKLLL
jgi:hypothetical protein